FDSVETRTIGEHPASKDTANLSIQCDFIHFNEAIRTRSFILRARIADFRRYLKRTKLDSLIDIDIECRDASGDFIETRELSNRIGDAFGHGCLKAAGGRNQ